MFADRKVFIIGAGASAEFKLPVGSSLMVTIKQNCRTRFDYSGMKERVPEIYHELTGRYPDKAEMNLRYEAMAEINRSIDLAGSIDVNHTWIRTFTQSLFERVKNDEFEKIAENIPIICFNYDRCI